MKRKVLALKSSIIKAATRCQPTLITKCQYLVCGDSIVKGKAVTMLVVGERANKQMTKEWVLKNMRVNLRIDDDSDRY